MRTLKEEQENTSTSKEKLQSPKNVPCSVCLDAVESAGDRSIALLKCGHHFHLDCIGSAFNAKGAMQCPNCRQVEGGQWLFSSGCYLQQQLLRNSNSDEDNTYAGTLFSLYPHEERLTHPNRRPPFGAYRQIPIQSNYPSLTNRWQAEVPPRNVHLNELARPLTSDLDSLHAGGMYMQSSQAMHIHRAPLRGTVLPNSHMLEGPMPRQWMDEDEFVHHREGVTSFASSHRHAINRGAADRHREPAFGMLALPGLGNVEQSMSRFQDTRNGQSGGVAYNSRRAGVYMSRTFPGLEWGDRAFASAYGGESHHVHPFNRAGGSNSYHDGYQPGATWM